VSETTALLRAGLLEGASVMVASAASTGSLGVAVGETCAELGARVHTCAPETVVEEAGVDRAVSAAVEASGGLELLVVDGAALFARGGLRSCLDAAWSATRAVVDRAFLPAESSSRARRIVYLAPAPGAGEFAGAARAGLENLSRTLSTEWARHGITVVTIAPGEGTAASEVAALCAYLASPAGDYFSGCLLDLRGV
jgi:NAD(P)-dependent dehydrogenase (short-subunit alcohol dehydrogenase family)